MTTTLEGKRESKAAAKRREASEAADYLRRLLPPGSTVYTTLKHVSRSGMARRIAVIVDTPEGPRNVSGRVAEVLGWRWCDDGSVAVLGCGMDMGFHLAYALAYTLHKRGFPCIGESCPANDHSNERTPDYTVGRMHSDPGYSLRHRWL